VFLDVRVPTFSRQYDVGDKKNRSLRNLHTSSEQASFSSVDCIEHKRAMGSSAAGKGSHVGTANLQSAFLLSYRMRHSRASSSSRKFSHVLDIFTLKSRGTFQATIPVLISSGQNLKPKSPSTLIEKESASRMQYMDI
jgi:hypothetical protein